MPKHSQPSISPPKTLNPKPQTLKVQLLYVLEVLLVDSCHRLFPLEKSHSSDLEPYASPGLSECERRNPKGLLAAFASATSPGHFNCRCHRFGGLYRAERFKMV